MSIITFKQFPKHSPTVFTTLVIGIGSFALFESRIPLGNWHAPATVAEMKALIRAAMELRAAPNDAPRLEYLDQFADEVRDLPHWRQEADDSGSVSKYTREELQAFVVDWAAYYNDEWARIAETYYYYLFWQARDITSPDWSNNLLARTNPTVCKFLLGLGIDLQIRGSYPIQAVGIQEMFHTWWAFEPFLLAAQDRHVLLAGRRTSAAFGAGSLMLVFLMGRRLGGRVGFATGLLGALLLYNSPVFHYYATRATVDVMLVFFLFASGLMTTYFVPIAIESSAEPRFACARISFATAMFGILSGLTFGVKLNGSLIGVGAALGCVIACVARYSRWRKSRTDTDRLSVAQLLTASGALLAAGVLTFAIFFASNPYYYHSPLSHFRNTLREMDETMAHCQQAIGPAVGSRFEAAKVVFYYGAMLTGKQGGRMITPGRSMPFEPMDRNRVVAPVRFCARAIAVLIGLVIGVGSLLWEVFRTGGYRAGLCCGLIGWCLSLVVGTVLWLPLRWDRYILVTMAPGIVLVSYGWCVASAWISAYVAPIIQIPPPREAGKVS